MESHPMNGGDGTYSYAKNSSFQRRTTDDAKTMILEAIAEKLDIKALCKVSTTFSLADFGCSVGPNTFIAMENVIEAVKSKFIAQGLASQIPEFQVFLNDHASNDFNTLFASLPPERPYLAVGVPGSFYGRLFPQSTLHFAHSATALQWLSKVPEELVDKSSAAWNKGRVHYGTASDEVADAYATQFGKDMGLFLDARAKELVVGGLIVLILPAVRNGNPHCCTPIAVLYDLLGSTLTDMAKEEVIGEDRVDSFNMPIYVPSPREMTQVVEENKCFSIERMDLIEPNTHNITADHVRLVVMHLRAGNEGIISKHFGTHIMDQLFDRLLDKTQDFSHKLESSFKEATQLYVVLKRK